MILFGRLLYTCTGIRFEVLSFVNVMDEIVTEKN